jgi:hypothetical protein
VVSFGHRDQYISGLPGDRKTADIERLRIHFSVDRQVPQLAKSGGVDRLRGEHRF